jgi:hypothetical protein
MSKEEVDENDATGQRPYRDDDYYDDVNGEKVVDPFPALIARQRSKLSFWPYRFWGVIKKKDTANRDRVVAM